MIAALRAWVTSMRHKSRALWHEVYPSVCRGILEALEDNHGAY